MGKQNGQSNAKFDKEAVSPETQVGVEYGW